MLERICTQIAHKIVSFLGKTLFKLHKISGKQIESSKIDSLILT